MTETTTQTYKAVVQGLPFPQPRVKASRIGEQIRMYTPDPGGKLSAWQQIIRLQTKRAHFEIIEGPIEVQLVIFLPRPKNHYRTGRWSDELKPDAPAYPIAQRRDDVDNHAKAIMDVLTGIAWTDDAQVVRLVVTKRFETARGHSGAVIKIRPMED